MEERPKFFADQPAAAAAREEAEDAWWQACYVTGSCDDVLQAPERSVAVFARRGGGKSTALAAAARELAGIALVAKIDARRVFVRPPPEEERERPTLLQVLIRAACGAASAAARC